MWEKKLNENEWEQQTWSKCGYTRNFIDDSMVDDDLDTRYHLLHKKHFTINRKQTDKKEKKAYFK